MQAIFGEMSFSAKNAARRRSLSSLEGGGLMGISAPGVKMLFWVSVVID